MSDVEIASVADFHSHLRQLEPAERGFFYRGQSDSTWKVSCGAARRLAVESSDKTEIETVDSHVLIGYLDFLVDRAKARGFLPHGFAAPTSISDLELMAQLQHQGAATGLIDFTRQPLVALWFACNGSENIDGVVYILPQSVTQELSSTGTTAGNGAHMQALFMENTLWAWEPSVQGNRIVAQSSVLVFGAPVLPSEKMEKIFVPPAVKGEILVQLEAVYGIKEEVLFSDFPGYAVANATDKAFDIRDTISYWLKAIESATGDEEIARAHRDCGLAFRNIGDHELAEKHFDRAARIEEGK
jgi:hypothetical protein